MLPLVFRFNTFLIKDDKLVIHSRMTPSYCCRPSGRWSKVKEEASHHHRSSKEMLRHWLWLSQNEQLFRGEVSSTEICGARYEPPSPRPCRELDFTFSNSHFHFVTMLSHETSSHFSAALFCDIRLLLGRSLKKRLRHSLTSQSWEREVRRTAAKGERTIKVKVKKRQPLTWTITHAADGQMQAHFSQHRTHRMCQSALFSKVSDLFVVVVEDDADDSSCCSQDRVSCWLVICQSQNDSSNFICLSLLIL